MDWYSRQVGLRIGGHRGAPEAAPENTWPSFEAAVSFGVDYIETDIQRTADGILVLLHDDDLDRTTAGSGPVAGATAADVFALDAGSWFSAEFASERLLALDPFLTWVEEHPDIGAEIDIKATGIGAELAERISRSPARDRLALCSSLADELAEAKDAYQPLTCFLILDDASEDAVERVRACNADGGDMPWDWLDADLVGRMREHGLAIMGSTANDEDEIVELIRRGADFVDSDRPRMALATRRRHAPAG